jgi:tetratricopeptide (TPR) repeat protein
MKVPFTLRRLPSLEPARALLLPGHDVQPLLDLCARLCQDPLPQIFAVSEGFLLKLRQPTSAPFPGVIRLRALADNLFVPCDAELVPALHDDEAGGLVAPRGLVFLPGGRVLAFAHDQPLALAQLLRAENVRRRAWQPLPAAPPLAERIREILLERPEETGDAILSSGGGDIGTENPQPDDVDTPTRLLSQAQLAAGRGLMGLGKLLGAQGLARLGASWVKNAIEQAPRLSEALLGQQEAALRNLLRDFREGNLERALRRALPLGSPGDRGGIPARNAQLPFHNLTYSLANLLGGSGGGPGSVWFGGYDVHAELLREYRKAAEDAVKRGDFRRAAFIYGKLLRDYRMAAHVLMQGGLHHDAAVLYLDKLGDVLAAARAFEAAGEIDRAVELYRQRNEHVLAAELLRRAGDEEAALKEFVTAAEQLMSRSPPEFLQAGELLLKKAGITNLAEHCFVRGWRERPASGAAACGLHLARLYSEETDPERLLKLVGEAEQLFSPPGNDVMAADFFNAVAKLAERDNLAPVRGELRDRMLLGIAGKLRQRAVEGRPGGLVSSLLGQSGVWAPAAVTDAQFALQAATKQPREKVSRPTALTRIPVAEGPVTAVCFAPNTGDVFLGCAGGDVVCFQPGNGEVWGWATRLRRPVTSLACDKEGQRLVVMHAGDDEQRRYLSAYQRGTAGTCRPLEVRAAPGPGVYWLAPLLTLDEQMVAVWEGEAVQLLRGPQLIPAGRVSLPFTPDGPATALLLPSPIRVVEDKESVYAIHAFAADSLWSYATLWHGLEQCPLGWTPRGAEGDTLTPVPLAWLLRDRHHLEVAGLEQGGSLYWSLISFPEHGKPKTQATAVSKGEVYVAAALVRPGLVAAVGRSRVDWLRATTNGFTAVGRTPASIFRVAACFPSFLTGEVIVVCGDGFVVRVPVPV